MTFITTFEEMELLNSILPHLALAGNGRFNISEIHATKLIYPAYAKIDGTIDFLEAVAKRKTFEDKYKVITSFLIQNNFIIPINDTQENEYFILTTKGEHLAAHGKFYTYENILKIQLTEDEIKSRIPSLIQAIMPYSEFTLVPNPRPPRQIIVLNYGNKTESERIAYVKDIVEKSNHEYLEIIVKEHIDFVKDERVGEYLVNHGFAINRYDIVRGDKLFRQLTDKGRELHKLGTIEAYDLDFENNNRRKLLQDQRVNYLFWINFWIAVGAVTAAFYYLTQTVDYLDKLFAKCPHFYYSVAVTIYLLLLGGLIGICTTIAIQQWRKTKRKKQSNRT